jgi:hypothetical protein
MEEWLLMQGFYHGLTQKAREHLDATAEGSFLSLTVGKAELLMEKISENQGWSQDHSQYCYQSEETIAEVNALSTKMDDLLNGLTRGLNTRRIIGRLKQHTNKIQTSQTRSLCISQIGDSNKIKNRIDNQH